jgi:hypothetical protein
MDDIRSSTTETEFAARQLEIDADRLLIAVEALAESGASDAGDAARYAERIRFALTRLAQLREDARREGGAFAPARVEVATSILETHVHTTAEYVNRTQQRVRRTAARRSVHVAVAEACASVETHLSRAA